MEEAPEKENKGLETAGVIMRLALLFGTTYEFLMTMTLLGAPFFIWNLVNPGGFEYSGLFVLIVVLLALFIYIPYLFISHQIAGKTFGQANFKSIIVRLDGAKLGPEDIRRRLLVKFTAFIILLLLGTSLSFFVFNKYAFEGAVWEWSNQIGSSLFFASLISLILILPFLSKKTQTVTDYFSHTKILVNYEGIKQEERDHLNKIIENPTILLAGVSGASVVTFGAVFIMMVIAFSFKVSGKRL